MTAPKPPAVGVAFGTRLGDGDGEGSGAAEGAGAEGLVGALAEGAGGDVVGRGPFGGAWLAVAASVEPDVAGGVVAVASGVAPRVRVGWIVTAPAEAVTAGHTVTQAPEVTAIRSPARTARQ